ncbi:MAG TPA: GNAT family N-acetyltransferase [Dehalococcoidia bacterium]|nr:GNAT family N-acetyltransferase [Dehalococcoidia bacterium]
MALTVERADIASLEPEWREALAACPRRYPFYSPTWLQHWWDVFVDDHELVLLAVRDGERLAGVLPFMRTGNQITFAGDTEICDYMDMIAPGGDYAALWTAALRSLGEEPWEEIALWAVREDSPTVAALPEACRELGLTFVSEQEDVCPQLELPGDWEEYISSLGKKDRHELRRKLRKLPQAGAVEVEVLESPAEVEPALDDFLRMHRESRADKANFMTDQMEGFFRKVVVALAAEGVAEMTFLKLADVRAACLLCFKAGDDYLLYNSGYDPAYAGFSVGLLSKALALQRAIERGYKRFDFLRGHEHYKYDLGARDVNVYRCAIRRA